VVLAAREMKREPKNERAILLAPFFALFDSRSSFFVPRSFAIVGRRQTRVWPMAEDTYHEAPRKNFKLLARVTLKTLPKSETAHSGTQGATLFNEGYT